MCFIFLINCRRTKNERCVPVSCFHICIYRVLLLLTYLCFTDELWHRHSRNSMIMKTTEPTIRRDSWVSSATVTVKQGNVRLKHIHLAPFIQSVKVDKKKENVQPYSLLLFVFISEVKKNLTSEIDTNKHSTPLKKTGSKLRRQNGKLYRLTIKRLTKFNQQD